MPHTLSYCALIGKCALIRLNTVILRKMRLEPINDITVKILKIGTPEIITIIVLRLERLDFTVQYCVQKMQTE